MGSVAAFIVAFVLGSVLSRAFRRSLSWLISRERKPGKEKIHRLFPKPRRPLGGGLALLCAASLAAIISYFSYAPSPILGWTLALAWGFALVGFTDDLKKAQGRGMKEQPKLVMQLFFAGLFGYLLWRYEHFTAVQLPFGGELYLGYYYIAFAALVVIATTNAVNLADGIDGLAGGAAVTTLLGFVVVGIAYPEHAPGPVVWPLLGAVMGFLTRNLPPGKILLGDTGALGLGAAIASLALFTRTEFWLLLLAAPFVVDAASVVIQMFTVRWLWKAVRPLRHRTTETARPFLCTPIHHHFQWLGWQDWRVLGLFWGFGAIMAAWAALAFASGVIWLVGIFALVGFLLGASLQKWFRANYFLGFPLQADRGRQLALFRGVPMDFFSWPLYRLHYQTSITEGMLVGATAESMLWRPITEVEAHVVLGKIYADHKFFDEALAEWEQVPTRNLLLRPNVVLRLARVYYGRDRLLEAIKLWEQLPSSRLADMPNVREVVRNARLRLADLASKSFRQCMRLMRAMERTGNVSEQAEGYLLAARRYNQDLLSLLLYERDRLRGRRSDPQAARERRELLRQTRNAVMSRLNALDGALAQVARTAPLPEEVEVEGGPLERAARELQITAEELLTLLSGAGVGRPQVVRAAIHPKESRNIVCRLTLTWPQGGPASVVIKRYAPDRIAFFSASYRRERGVLELLHKYGAAVPQVYGGELRTQQALLVMQDLGDETLAERLEEADTRTKTLWLRTAVQALVNVQATVREHEPELEMEIHKTDKDRLGPEYYYRALRIALERITTLGGGRLEEEEWNRLYEQAGPLVDFLTSSPPHFIHFELTPHHFLVAERGLYMFDCEQATMGPEAFDLAALLAQPESDVGVSGWEMLLKHYRELTVKAGLPEPEELERGVAYSALFKCLIYAGAAANFLGKFGGEHHLQRFHYYLEQCQQLAQRWAPLRPLGTLLQPRLRAAKHAASNVGQEVK